MNWKNYRTFTNELTEGEKNIVPYLSSMIPIKKTYLSSMIFFSSNKINDTYHKSVPLAVILVKVA